VEERFKLLQGKRLEPAEALVRVCASFILAKKALSKATTNDAV
jgi:hypothetical protein